MTTKCLHNGKNYGSQNAYTNHRQVEAPESGAHLCKDKRNSPKTTLSNRPYMNTPSNDLKTGYTVSPEKNYNANEVEDFQTPEASQKNFYTPDFNCNESGYEKLTFYFYRKECESLQPSNAHNGIKDKHICRSTDFKSMNGIGKCSTTQGTVEPTVSTSSKESEPQRSPDVDLKNIVNVKSPDSESVDTFLSAKSHFSEDELDKSELGAAQQIEGQENDTTTDHGLDVISLDDVDGPIMAEPSAQVCLSPAGSATSSTLSPGSSEAPGVVVISPPSPSTSQPDSVRASTSLPARPTTLGASGLGAIPKTRMASLSPSYRPRDKKEVSLEAMRVLDSLINRSQSQYDTSPSMHPSQGIEDRSELSAGPDDIVKTKDKINHDDESPLDDDGSHSPLSKTTSIYSSSSHSSSFKHKIVPLSKKDVDDALQKNQRKKHLVKRRKKSHSDSSTSTDEEIVNNRQERRKRQSLFKRAKDKLRRSLKYRSEFSMRETKKRGGKSSVPQSPAADAIGQRQTKSSQRLPSDVNRSQSDGDGSATPLALTAQTNVADNLPDKSAKRSDTLTREKEKKDQHSLFDSLLQHIRSGTAKLRKKSTKKPLARSNSVEELPVEDADGRRTSMDKAYASWSLDKGRGRRGHGAHSLQSKELEEDSADGPRRNFKLDGLVRYQPAPMVNEETEEGNDVDDVDFHSPSVAEKPHLQRTHSEREHIYEKVADQLAAIADNYDISSPLSPERNKQMVAASESREPIILPGSLESSVDQEVRKELGTYLRDKGDKMAEEMPQLNPIVKDLVKNVSYTHFQNVLHQQMGADNNIQQIALFFKVIKQAVQTVGYGTAMAMQLKEMSLCYFEDRYADWVIGQGGWESIADETDLSSEVD